MSAAPLRWHGAGDSRGALVQHSSQPCGETSNRGIEGVFCKENAVTVSANTYVLARQGLRDQI